MEMGASCEGIGFRGRPNVVRATESDPLSKVPDLIMPAFPTLQSLRAVLPFLLAAALFSAGVYALFRLLGPVKPADVAAQLQMIPTSLILAALGATIVGYISMIFYDYYALRFIGKSVDPGVVALGGFLGYAFGNTIGLSVVSGGAVRYRIYSAAGLNALEVAAVSAYVAGALALGLVSVGLFVVGFRPDAAVGLLPLNNDWLRLAAVIVLTVLVLGMVWISVAQPDLKFKSFDLRMPAPRDLFGQLVVTLVDILAAGFALWILLPAGKPDFATFTAIFSIAMMVGVISNVPGGIGVFEAVLLAALPSTVALDDSAAALLLYRLIYFVVPFVIAFLLVALNEVRLTEGWGGALLSRVPRTQSALAALHGMSPWLVGFVALGTGAYFLLVTIVPSVQADAISEGDIVGLLLVEGGTLTLALAGVSLMILSRGLARRVSSAYWLALAALAAGTVGTLLHDLDFQNAALLAVIALALLPFRRAFNRPGRLTEGVFETRWFLTVLGAALAAGMFLLFVHKAEPFNSGLWSEFSADSDLSRSLRAGLVATALLLVFAIYILTRPVRLKLPADSDPQSLARAADLARSAPDPQAWFSQTGDKRFLFSDSGNAFIMYAVRGGSWIALGDPVGDPDEFNQLCWSFAEVAAASNGRPVFYEVSGRNLPLWVELGLSLNKVGEEAVVRLEDFSLTGKKFKTMRAAFNKRQRDGYEFRISPAPHSEEFLQELGTISDSWLGGKSGREKGFSVGRFNPDYLGHFDIAVVTKDGRTIAFANTLVTRGGVNVAVDLMRYLPEEASGTMEFMFISLIEHYKAAGAEEFSLGAAPLAGLSERSIARSWIRFGRLIYRHGGVFYNFEGLRAFKQKFQPEWRPRYLALPANTSPLIALRDVALLIAGTTRGLVGK